MWGIAWRNFFLQGMRYRVLGTALVLGAIVFTLLFGITASLTKTVREKAARYFSGDIVVLAVETKGNYPIDEEGAILDALRRSQVPMEALHRRSVYYNSDAQLFFNGASLIQRRVVGVDFSVEAPSFEKLDYVEGLPPTAEGSPDSVWVSDDTARRLHLKLGEKLILMVATVQGYKNTINLKVAGIFSDSSLFGFACYLDYRTLNRGLGRAEGAVTELGVTLSDSADEHASAVALQAELDKSVRMAPLSASKEALDKWANGHKNDPKAYGLLTLTARLKQINDLIEGIRIVNLLLTLVFLVVVSIGVYNTYQMIVFERTKEIGTMRALGLQRNRVVFLFLSECLILGILGGLGGLFLGTFVLWGLGKIDFSGNLLAEMFLVRGHLAWVWPLENVSQVLAVMIVTTITGAFFPALKGASRSPVDSLRQE